MSQLLAQPRGFKGFQTEVRCLTGYRDILGNSRELRHYHLNVTSHKIWKVGVKCNDYFTGKRYAMTIAQKHLPVGKDPINVKMVKFNSCRCLSSRTIIIPSHAVMAEADRRLLLRMFTANIAFKNDGLLQGSRGWP